MHTSPKSFSAVEEILRFNAGRMGELLKIQYVRLAENVFAFFRGADSDQLLPLPLFLENATCTN